MNARTITYDDLGFLQPQSIAILQVGKLGDMILTTPLFNALKKLYAPLHLTVIATESTAIIPSTHRAVDEVIPLPRGIVRQIPSLTSHLRAKRFDLYIDIKDHRSTTSRLIAELVRADRIIAHRSNIGQLLNTRKREHLLPPAVEPGHYVDKALAPLALLAPGEKFHRIPTLTIPRESFMEVDDQLNPGMYGLVAINISAGDRSRYWAPEKWKEVIAKLAKRYSIALISSPADRALADEICTTRKEARPVRTSSILEAAAVIERSLAVISPDTSIIHVASALDKPCIGLYPPSEANARTFAPLSKRHRVLLSPQGGEFNDIGVDRVLDAVMEVLREK
jgi:ADP-heptose:LPS heptosyltransferase